MSVQASQQITITDITDAYYVALTSEAYTFMGNTSGAPSGLSCTTQAVAYCGAKVCSKVTIGSITCPTGISAAITNNNTVSPTITFKTSGTITASCEAIIPISVDGVTINKKFSFAVAKTGATGEKGDKGNTGAAGQDGEDGQMLYATCSTAAGTKAKTATLSSGTLSLKAGATVSVKFTYANTAASPTLNVAGTGAKTICVNGATMTAAYYWVAGAVITFVYDGTYWNVSDAGALKKADDAAKTATNYMKFENGLIIGDMTSDTLGNNVFIDVNSVNIRNGNSVLASYGSITRIGKSDGFNLLIDADEMKFRNGNSILASYGTNVVIGKNNDFNVLIDSGGMSIRSGDIQTARYEANAIHLGKSDYSTDIYICDEAGLIRGYDDNILGESISIESSAKKDQPLYGGSYIRLYKNGMLDIFTIQNMNIANNPSIRLFYDSNNKSAVSIEGDDLLFNNSSLISKINDKIKMINIEITTDPYGQCNLKWAVGNAAILCVQIDGGYGAFCATGTNIRVFRISQLPLTFASNMTLNAYIFYCPNFT